MSARAHRCTAHARARVTVCQGVPSANGLGQRRTQMQLRLPSESFCPRSFDPSRPVMVTQWYNLRLETRETRVQVRTLPVPWAAA